MTPQGGGKKSDEVKEPEYRRTSARTACRTIKALSPFRAVQSFIAENASILSTLPDTTSVSPGRMIVSGVA